jgi:hypothetical protein
MTQLSHFYSFFRNLFSFSYFFFLSVPISQLFLFLKFLSFFLSTASCLPPGFSILFPLFFFTFSCFFYILSSLLPIFLPISCLFTSTAKTLYRKFETNILINETARPRSQFLHFYICSTSTYSLHIPLSFLRLSIFVSYPFFFLL